MKISTWYKKAFLALAAAGWLAPVDAYAVNIALGDPSFEAFSVPTTGPTAGYAYAGNTSIPNSPNPPIIIPGYRPNSAWISRPDDNFNGSFIDGGPQASNWIYNAAYAELSKPNANGTSNNPDHIAVGHRPARALAIRRCTDGATSMDRRYQQPRQCLKRGRSTRFRFMRKGTATRKSIRRAGNHASTCSFTMQQFRCEILQCRLVKRTSIPTDSLLSLTTRASMTNFQPTTRTFHRIALH